MGYTAACPAMKRFWKVLERMTNQERQALLKFVTSCSRAPLGGFAFLRPPFRIQKVIHISYYMDMHRSLQSGGCPWKHRKLKWSGAQKARNENSSPSLNALTVQHLPG